MSNEQDQQSPPPDEHFHEGKEAPPPGVRAMAIFRWALLALMALAAVGSLYTVVAPHFGHGEAAHASRYYCPMHPQITSDTPGECPICHMALEPIPEGRQQGASAAPPPLAPASAAPPTGYWCPMHPEVHSETPGATCEKCGGMVLVPVPTPEERAAEREATPPPGTAPVELALDRVQAIGVRTAPVESSRRAERLRVTAAVEAPEQGRAEVHVRAEGFVEAIRVKQTGVKVRAGELLASVYSPEIFQAQQELLAMRAWPGIPGPADAGAAPGAPPPPMAAARKRLELLGLGKAAVDRILKTGEPIRAVGVSSPISGYVVKKTVVLGSRVTPDEPLFEIVDLAKVYIIASVYPHQLAGIRVGDSATFTTPSLPGRSFEAKVDLIYPDVDLTTRTARVRFQVENDELALRPGQFGDAELASAPAEDLAVPLDAIVDTGRSVYVFVAKEGGRFEPRKVELGPELGDRVVVRGGLREGERVVSRATFLIDAESRLQASLAGTP